MNTINLIDRSVKVNQDYEKYRTWLMYAFDDIQSVEIINAKLEADNQKDEDDDAVNTVYYESVGSLESYIKQVYDSASLVYATKDSGFRVIKAYDRDNKLIKNLFDFMGVSIKKYDNPQKLTKRIKRLFRQTKYAIAPDSINAINREDADKTFDGMHFVGVQFLLDNGIKCEEYDRYSITFILDGKLYKGHAIAINMPYDVITYGKEIKEMEFRAGFNFIQLEPVIASDVVRCDIQTLVNMLADGVMSEEEAINDIMLGLSMVAEKLTAPIQANNNVETDNKLVRLGLHEVNMMFPHVVSMRWGSEFKSLSKFEKMNFPIANAVKGYACVDFEHDNKGNIVPVKGDALRLMKSNMFVPVNMVPDFKVKHGGCDWDDEMKSKPLNNGLWATWRSPNTMEEIQSYKIIF
jgi:hypothetical protein